MRPHFGHLSVAILLTSPEVPPPALLNHPNGAAESIPTTRLSRKRLCAPAARCGPCDSDSRLPYRPRQGVVDAPVRPAPASITRPILGTRYKKEDGPEAYASQSCEVSGDMGI